MSRYGPCLTMRWSEYRSAPPEVETPYSLPRAAHPQRYSPMAGKYIRLPRASTTYSNHPSSFNGSGFHRRNPRPIKPIVMAATPGHLRRADPDPIVLPRARPELRRRLARGSKRTIQPAAAANNCMVISLWVPRISARSRSCEPICQGSDRTKSHPLASPDRTSNTQGKGAVLGTVDRQEQKLQLLIGSFLHQAPFGQIVTHK